MRIVLGGTSHALLVVAIFDVIGWSVELLDIATAWVWIGEDGGAKGGEESETWKMYFDAELWIWLVIWIDRDIDTDCK
jgi:hypothetical protein